MHVSTVPLTLSLSPRPWRLRGDVTACVTAQRLLSPACVSRQSSRLSPFSCWPPAGPRLAARDAGTASGASRGDVRDLSFTSTTVAGEKFEGSTLAGKPTVLWFWAPWCPTCRGQIGGVSSLAEHHPDDLNVVGVGSLDDPTAIADFAAKVSPEVTMLSDDDGAVWRHFGVTAQSTYLVLDKDGNQVASGYLSDDELENVVEPLVG